jgi:hypothetical protein
MRFEAMERTLYDRLMQSSYKRQVEGATVVNIWNVDEYCEGQKFSWIQKQTTNIRPPFDRMILESRHNAGLWGVFIQVAGHYFTANLMESSDVSGKVGSAVGWQISINPDGSYLTDTMTHRASLDLHPQRERLLQVAMGRLWIALMAINFMHCRNVDLVDHVAAPAVHPRKKHLKEQPGVVYKTIVIKPMSAVQVSETSSAGGETIPRSAHIVRGHFATYSEDKPLLGKYVGTFWRPSHVRGSQDAGEIVKDYRIDVDGEA